MRSLSPATLAAFQGRSGFVARSLMWVTARDRATGAPQTFGFWTGSETLTFTIGGEARIYIGAGNLLGIDAIVMSVGITVQMQRVIVSPIAAEAALAIRGYDTRLAPVEIHRALFRSDSRALLDVPHRTFKGWVDTLSIDREAVGGSYSATMSIASATRALTRTLAATRSDADLRRRAPTDGFRKYASVTASVPFYWGMNGPVQTAAGSAAPGAGNQKPDYLAMSGDH